MTDMTIDDEVDALFATAPDRTARTRQNPVTGARWDRLYDRVKPQKLAARKALAARRHFDSVRPVDAPPLPLSYNDREALKGGFDLAHLTAHYARSWAASDFDDRHPDFVTYVRGVLALPRGGEMFRRHSPALVLRFPPKTCPGLAESTYVDMRFYVGGRASRPASSIEK